MPVYSLKIGVYDPEVICAFERLRKTRKQAAYTHSALKYFLSTEKGAQVLSLMEGQINKESCQGIFPVRSNTSCNETPVEQVVAKTHSIVTLQNDSSSVLNSIMK